MDLTRFMLNSERIHAVQDRWPRIAGLYTYVGKRKGDIFSSFDTRFGSDGWLPAHLFDNKLASPYEAYILYEEAYYHLLKTRPDIRQWIVGTASEVYDIDPSNVQSGLDYTVQECAATHLQDIAVRRALTRLKLEDQRIDYDPLNLPHINIFEGDHLVQIRGHESEGFQLNPGQVPFHKDVKVLGNHEVSWWRLGSVEDIYHRSKVLLVDPDRLSLRLALVASDEVYFADESDRYYRYRGDDPGNIAVHKGRVLRSAAQGGLLGDYCEITSSPTQPFTDLKDVSRGCISHRFPRINKRLPYSTLLSCIESLVREGDNTSVSYDLPSIGRLNAHSRWPDDITIGAASSRIRCEILDYAQKFWPTNSLGAMVGTQGNSEHAYLIDRRAKLVFKSKNNPTDSSYLLEASITRTPKEIHDPLVNELLRVKQRYETRPVLPR